MTNTFKLETKLSELKMNKYININSDINDNVKDVQSIDHNSNTHEIKVLNESINIKDNTSEKNKSSKQIGGMLKCQ